MSTPHLRTLHYLRGVDEPNSLESVIAQLSRAASVVTYRHHYHDQARFWTKAKLPLPIFREVRKLSGDFRVNHESLPNRWRMEKHGWVMPYVLFQPNLKALELLCQHLGDDILINYLELAIEFVTANEMDNEYLYNFLRDHLWQGHRSTAEPPKKCEQTIYTSPRYARHNLVLYPDRRSKITGAPCCVKLEYRVQQSRSCLQKGIRTARDLIDFDHGAFWKSRMRLGVMDLGKLERAIRSRELGIRLKSLRPAYRPHAKSRLICNIAALKSGNIGDNLMFQEIKAGWPLLALRLQQIYPLEKFLVRLPNTSFLT